MPGRFMEILTARLAPPETPARCEMADDKMAELVESIRAHGIMHPIVVCPVYQDHDGETRYAPDPQMGKLGAEPIRYEIIDGHRRSVAAVTLELPTVPVMVYDNPADAKLSMMLDATLCHEDISPFEEGVLFLELANKHGWPIAELMRRFNRTEHYINTRVDLVQKDPNVAEAARTRQINLSQAQQILREKDPARRLYLCDQAATHGANARTLAVMIHNHQQEQLAAAGAVKAHTPENATPPAPPPARVCVWCGEGTDVENLRQLDCHWYHERDLQAVLDQVGLRTLLKGAVR